MGVYSQIVRFLRGARELYKDPFGRRQIQELNQRLAWALQGQCRHTFHEVLGKLQRRNFRPATVIDVGCSDGRWSREVMTVFGEARYLLFECDSRHFPRLQAFQDSCRADQVNVVWAGASSSDEPQFLHAPTPDSGKLTSRRISDTDEAVPCTTIDREVARCGLTGPFFLKLDTHGFELPIFEGARAVLTEVGLLQVEVYNFTSGSSRLRFPQMCQHLENCGFRPLYLSDPLDRPRDGALFQIDLFFAPADSPEFSYEGW